MAYIVGSNIHPNAIAAHNATHREVHGSGYVHNDQADYDINGVKQALTGGTPTTLTMACSVLNSAKVIFNRHLARGGPELIFAHEVVDTTNVIPAAYMETGSFYSDAILAALIILIGALRTSYSNHIANKKPDGSASGVHAAVDSTYVLGAMPTLSTFDDVAVELNNLKAQLNLHEAFSSGGSPHLMADSTNSVTAANATSTDLDSMMTLANQIRSKLNAHFAQSGVHSVNDTFNTVSASSVANPSGIFDLAIAYKTAHNAHLSSATYHNSADSTNTLSYSSPTTIAGLIAAAAEVYVDLNAHLDLAPYSAAMVAS